MSEVSDTNLCWPFDDESASFDAMRAGLDAMFADVVALSTRLHGPLDRFLYDETNSVMSGNYVRECDRGGLEPICDGKRALGGALDRFFKAHWQLRRPDPLDMYLGTMLTASMNYGWALCELSEHLPSLNGVVDIRGITVPRPNI